MHHTRQILLQHPTYEVLVSSLSPTIMNALREGRVLWLALVYDILGCVLHGCFLYIRGENIINSIVIKF